MTEKPHLKPSLQTQNNAWLKNSQSYLTKRQMFLDTHAKIAGKISTSFRDSHQKKKNHSRSSRAALRDVFASTAPICLQGKWPR